MVVGMYDPKFSKDQWYLYGEKLAYSLTNQPIDLSIKPMKRKFSETENEAKSSVPYKKRMVSRYFEQTENKVQKPFNGNIKIKNEKCEDMEDYYEKPLLLPYPIFPNKTSVTGLSPIILEQAKIPLSVTFFNQDQTDNSDSLEACKYNYLKQLHLWRLYTQQKEQQTHFISQQQDKFKTEESPRNSPTQNTQATDLSTNKSHNSSSGLFKKKQKSNTSYLWEFLMELLDDPDSFKHLVSWVDREQGLFRLHDTKKLASLWGNCKNKPCMSYETMGRALRYYYTKGILRRIPGQRLLYQFNKLHFKHLLNTNLQA